MEDMARCPKCDGEIVAGARKCKHCGEFLDDALKQERSAAPARSAGPPPSNGAAVASLIFGLLGIFVCALGLVAVILGIVGLSKAGKHPAKPGHGLALAGLLLGILELLFIPIVIAIAIPNLLATKTKVNEISAINCLRSITSAQEIYCARTGEYAADLQKLVNAGHLDAGIAAAVDAQSAKNGYYFICEADAGYYSCLAMPAIPGSTGNRSFYLGTDGCIRQAPCRNAGDPPADESSPMLGGY